MLYTEFYTTGKKLWKVWAVIPYIRKYITIITEPIFMKHNFLGKFCIEIL